MEIKTIDGLLLKDLFNAGLASLRANEKTVNDLNVFPVPDGDTGSNMRMTIENGVKNTAENPSVGEFSQAFARGVLMGARGNSGVILSQYFKGLSLSLAGKDKASVLEFRDALVQAYKTAYKAVVTPTEGTILTVCRESIEMIYDQIDESTDLEKLIELWIKRAKVSLAETPEKLAVLKEAGVVDSGGAGLIYIFEGFLKYLGGEIFEEEIPTEIEHSNASAVKIDFKKIFNADSILTFGYCTEFILQLQNAKCVPAEFDVDAFVEFMKSVGGDSIVAFKDDDIVKVHVHTTKPYLIIAEAQKYGEFVTFKMENMTIQNAQVEAEKQAKKMATHKDIAYVAVCQGEGIIDIYKELGCDIVLNGGQTMNTSTEEFVEAFKCINADHIFVFPNNKNIVMAAEQAREIYKDAEIHVIKTASIAEGYFAFSMMDPDEKDPAVQEENIFAGIEAVTTVSTTHATRDTTVNGIVCVNGGAISLVGHSLVASDPSTVAATLAAMAQVEDIDSKEVIALFKGQSVSDEELEELTSAIAEKYPSAEVGVIDGKQDVYDFILGIC
ncbi:MAG: DAK2 domain-containing protein [Bacilli bacterium]|nr:DAK2 domain-containing protein [Bacilli bacterium]